MRKRKDTGSSKGMACDARDCWVGKVKQCMNQLNEGMFSVIPLLALSSFLLSYRIETIRAGKRIRFSLV